TTDGLELKLAKDINLTANGSVAFGTAATAPKVDATGLTISEQLKFTTAAISAGDLQINHVAAGEADTDAVNVSQLKALEKQVGAAGELTLVDKDGNPLVKDDKGNLYKESDIDENGKPIDGATPVNPEDTTLASDTGKSGLGQDNNGNNEAITPDKAKDLIGGTKGEDGTRGKDGLLDKTGPTLNNIATIKDLQALAQAGLDFAGDDGTEVHRALSQKLTITGGADVSTPEAKAKLTDGNIGVVANDTTDGLELKLAKDINLTANGSVAFGTAATAPKVDATGLTISEQLKFTTAAISAGDLQINHVAAGGR
ncbi:hypothetical protein VER_08825, partial [Veillonella sp. R32]